MVATSISESTSIREEPTSSLEQIETGVSLADVDKDSSSSSAQEMNVLGSIEGQLKEESTDRVMVQAVKEPEPRLYSCNYCQRKFYSSQALGGHQNAHKRERSLFKHVGGSGQHGGSTRFNRGSWIHYTHLSHSILHHLTAPGGLYRDATTIRPLDIQAQSLVAYKSYMHGRLNRAWPITTNMHHQEVIGRLVGDELYIGKARPTQRYDDPMGGYQWFDNEGVAVVNRRTNTTDLTDDEPTLDLTLRL